MALQPNAAPASRQPQAFGVKEQRPDGLEPSVFRKNAENRYCYDKNEYSGKDSFFPLKGKKQIVSSKKEK